MLASVLNLGGGKSLYCEKIENIFIKISCRFSCYSDVVEDGFVVQKRTQE